MKNFLALIALTAAFTPLPSVAVSIDLVPVGNPGNTGEIQASGIFGRVTTSYQIAKFEVTNAQYVEFLNAKAANDTYELYNALMGLLGDGGIVQTGTMGAYTYSVKPSAAGAGPNGTAYTYGDKPVNYVSWYDAIRFANWMSNGQGSASTETGAYTLLGGTTVPSNANSISRNANASWFLPTENEWYKAAYYNAATSSYFDYPTGSDATPNNNLPAADTGNSANYKIGSVTTTGDPLHPLTPVGAYLVSDSPYGTFDQGGNVAEWTETSSGSGVRVRRGGGWNSTDTYLSSATRETVSATVEISYGGFRLAAAAVPAGVPGDYNGNGVVDAADYVIWRDHLGTSFQLTNEVAGTTPGTVTQEDHTAWRARFGNISGSGTGSSLGSAAVPEPSAFVASLVLVLAALITRNHRR